MENQTAMQEFIEYLELTYGSLDPFIKEIYLKKEKEQIIEAYDVVQADEQGNMLNGEQYYKENYNSNFQSK